MIRTVLVAALLACVVLEASAASGRMRPVSVPSSFKSFNRKLPSLAMEMARRRPVESFGEAHAQTYNYTSYEYTQTVDHFNFEDSRTYQQRYLVNDQYYQPGGPIFFYTGNEGTIEMFVENTGIMFEKAPKYNALIVFGEHRYYGKSMPFGNSSFSPENVGYLTSEQALADYAYLVPYVASKFHATGAKVIAFGGSYGGMLSGWFRLKYPNVVDGALAASAPINQFPGFVSPYIFSTYVTDDFKQISTTCSSGVRTLLESIYNDGQDPTKLAGLLQTFNSCPTAAGKTPPTVDDLIAYIDNAVTYMAMTDYPYPTSFLQPMPAWPVQAFCTAFGSGTTPADLNNAIQVYYNYTKAVPCAQLTQDDTSPGLGTDAWNYQACTEMVLPTAMNGQTDFFYPPQLWDLASYEKSCQSSMGVTPRPEWIETHYGGLNISSGSNIVFSNGMLDPWQGGGLKQSLSDTLIAILIPKAAHHLDLRASNPADPAEVTAARDQEWSYLEKFMGLSSETKVNTIPQRK